ncbi:ATP-dependent DNA helicase Rep [bacterium]|nr:ATP-dependent DNA helicase Rep [bacterium]NBW57994.1 ATP-dependent DNA helicase Rep [bacterium]
MVQLNQQQFRAVKLLHKPCLVIAGAGSGKTSTICQKIAHLAAQDSIYHKILAITFTNKAARELSARLQSLHVNKKLVSVLTFHSLGLKVIQEFGSLIGIKKNFTLYDTQDKHQLLKDILTSCPEEEIYQAAHIISLIKHYTDSSDTLDKIAPEALSIWRKYEEALLHINAIDLDDLVFKAYKLSLLDEVSTALKKKFGYIFIDEYQDTNIAQYLFFKNIAHARRFTVVGDDDQSIYTWRGANPANLNMLSQDFEQLEIIKLEENFRSSPQILDAANALIAHNNHLFEKKLWSNKPSHEKVFIITGSSEDDELEQVLNQIVQREHLNKNVCILFRTNYQAVNYEKGLRDKKIPYQLLGANSVFNKTEIKDLVSYLRLLINPDDDQSFKRIINIPKRGLGSQTIAPLLEYANKYNLSLLYSIQQIRFLLDYAGKNKNTFEQFYHLIDKYRKIMSNQQDLNWIEDLLKDTDYYNWIEHLYSKKAQIDKKTALLQDFISWLKRMYIKTPNLDQVMKKIMLIDMLDKKEDAHQKVTLSTIHAAKGLEFDEVYLIGCIEGILPHHQSDNNIQEERRLMYVAMTRAKERLVLSYPKTFAGKDALKSRFLEEIPQNMLTTFAETGPKSWEELRLLLGY